uniref:Uncharacterized protein n=1 Tax=Salix viminalis TaxID=40686 RepID=A0A6N2KP26_SALVM
MAHQGLPFFFKQIKISPQLPIWLIKACPSSSSKSKSLLSFQYGSSRLALLLQANQNLSSGELLFIFVK